MNSNLTADAGVWNFEQWYLLKEMYKGRESGVDECSIGCEAVYLIKTSLAHFKLKIARFIHFFF